MRSSPSQKPSLLLDLLDILESVLDVLSSRIGSDRTQKHMHPERDSHETECKYKHNPLPIPLPVLAELQIPEAQETKQTSQYERNRTLQIWLTVGTWLAFLAAAIYAGISLKIWGEMKEQTRVQRDVYITSQRPWIKIVDVESRGNSPFIPAFSFQGFGHGPFPNATKQATLQLKISLKNIGHSLAFVSADFELFFPAWKQESFEDIILAEENRFCDASAQKVPSKYLSRIVFPEEPLDWYGAGVQAVGPIMFASNTINHAPDDSSGDYVLPMVIACANYTFPASSKKISN
jgi:hypothetical protein